MKNIRTIALLFLLLAAITSCEDDNYAIPAETFKGSIVDAETGEPFQTAIGTTGTRITMMEYSWSENPTPYYLYCMMDGHFNNTKVFEGQYGIKPEGAFVPLEEETIKIEGTVEKNYAVDPFLRIEWVGDPVMNADGTVTIQVKIDRGTSNPDYQQALAEVWLYVSETQYAGDFSYSPNFSTHLTGATLPALGETVSITTGWPGGIGTGTQRSFPDYTRKYFLRVGARIDKQVNSTNVYNYTSVKEITTQ
uniref:DUF3823 domain-containing protein n=1 Tax=Roseihalotalea indica TaxID=2867963 RepID=A0AA49GKT7_9BACT|nr:DUF3823 domain-containing protein [Tunicatimonas sp. TK19036]